MMRHSPAGRRIQAGVFKPQANYDSANRWSPVAARYFDSGTSALAVAIGEALATRANVKSAEVLLPAYACPNLVAAAVFAGARHRFVDFHAGGSSPSSDDLRSSAAADHLSVVVDFCGVPTAAAPLPGLIQDMAQSYAPFLARWTPLSGRTVVSFGRAKPVSLTLGGALLGDPGTMPAAPDEVRSSSLQRRARIYNLSLDPRVFGVLARLPFLGIGDTRYQPLPAVRALAGDFPALADAAVREFRLQQATAVEGTRRALRFAAEQGLTLPFDLGRLPADLPLWRVPVLFDEASGAEAFANAAAPYGVSRLYRKTLPEFLGVDAETARRQWPNAWHLSRTLVTLPTHGRLAEADWTRLGRLLESKKRTAP
jgi:hypothetical protein